MADVALITISLIFSLLNITTNKYISLSLHFLQKIPTGFSLYIPTTHVCRKTISTLRLIDYMLDYFLKNCTNVMYYIYIADNNNNDTLIRIDAFTKYTA